MKENRHKHETVGKGPFKFTKAGDKTVIIDRSYFSVEDVSHARVDMAPKTITKEEVINIFKSFKVDFEYPKI